MGQPLTVPPAFEKLTVREQLAEVVDRRLRDYRSNPGSAVAWEELRAELLARFGRNR